MDIANVRNAYLKILFLLLLFFYFTPESVSNEKVSPWVYHLNMEQGLPGNWVRSIIEDDFGVMWFGTWNGLSSWDGTVLKNYKKEAPGASLKSNMITKLKKDLNGDIYICTAASFVHLYNKEKDCIERLEVANDTTIYTETARNINFTDDYIWIGTNFGLVKYSRKSKNIELIEIKSFNSKNKLQRINCTLTAKDGLIWTGTNYGIQYFDFRQNTFIKKTISNKNLFKIKGRVNTFYKDQHGRIWIGTEDGLYFFDDSKKEFQKIPYIDSKSKKKINIEVKSIHGLENQIYLGTSIGLLAFNSEKEKYFDLSHDITDKHTINTLNIDIVFCSSTGMVWVGTYNGGVNYFKPGFKGFIHINKTSEGLCNPYVLHFAEDREGNIWVGTEDGITKFNNELTNSTCFLQNEENSNNTNNIVTNLMADYKNDIWISLYDKGLAKLNKEKNEIENLYTFKEFLEDKNSTITSIIESDPGIFCIGLSSFPSDESFFVFDANEKKAYKFRDFFDLKCEPIKNVQSLFKEQESGNLLITTQSNIRYFNREKKKVEKLFYEHNHGILYNAIIDRNKNIWVGTPSGIYRITENNIETRIRIDKLNLSSSAVLNIFEDKEGSIWFTTANELIKIPFDNTGRKNINFQVYNAKNELQFGEFKQNASLVSSSGRIFIGGNDGFNHFEPENIKVNERIPEVIITDIFINNKEQHPSNDESILEKNIKSTREIKLSHNQSNLKLKFACLNFLLPEKNEFACKMEGLEEDWRYLDNQSEVTYHKIPMGEYTFRVKASNNSGIWNEAGVALKIEVLPPWWKSTWFYILLVIVIISSLLLFYRIKTQNIKKRNKYLKEKIFEKTENLLALNDELKQRNAEIAKRNEQVESLAKQLSQTNEQKLRLFTNISHEFRTPLSLIISSADEGKKDEYLSKSQRKNLLIINQNAARLKVLVDQIIDLRRIEQNVMLIQISEYDLAQVIKEVVLLFNDIVEKRAINLSLKLSAASNKTYFDIKKVENILINLLSNAFKHTPNNGEIHVSLDYNQKNNTDYAVVTVKDNGEGISEKDLPNIFERYYSSDSRSGNGIGIGLSFCKEQVELHKGSIHVKSKEGKGSEFIMEIPVSKKYLTSFKNVEIGIVKPGSNVKDLITGLNDEIVPETPKEFKINRMRDNSLPIILIIEDHPELRKNVVKGLYELGNIYEAENGFKGLQLAESLIPDIIISDVLMPEMDGITMCNKIKNNEITNHIPIILLTAKTDDNSELEGLTKGADDYLTKPFNINILRQRVSNTLKIRESFMLEFSNKRIVKENQTTDTTHQKYMNYVSKIIEEHIHDTEFSVEHLGKILNMDRFQLYRKIHSISGLSPSKFIIKIRLLKALDLLKENKTNVSEVAYYVGFNSSSYFAKCFKEAFGVQPSKYNELYIERKMK